MIIREKEDQSKKVCAESSIRIDLQTIMYNFLIFYYFLFFLFLKNYNLQMLISNEDIKNNGDIQRQPTLKTQSSPNYDQFKIQNLISLDSFAHSSLFSNIQYPWEVLPHIAAYVQKYVSQYTLEKKAAISIIGSVHIDDDVIIGEGTTIEHGAMIKGPTLIGKNCQIRKGAYIRGNVVIGDNCVIGNSTELKNCVVLNKAQICHFNYVGDSVLGEGAHLSAGAITSNLKLDQKQVVIRTEDTIIETGLKKFGSIIGDYCEIGCNVVLNPGSVLGRRCVIYPGACIRGVVPSDHIVKLLQERMIVHKA